MTIPGNTYRVPMTAAALAILLAACGSGSSHDDSHVDTKALSGTTPAATTKHATKADAAQAGDTEQANAAAQAGDAAQAANTTQAADAAQAAAAAPASPANAESAAAPATDASGTISSATAANRTAVADTAEASTVTQAAPQTAPISAAGVRGDALTMLDQKGCLNLHHATSYNGTRVTTGQPLELPELRADTGLNPSNYQKTTPNSPGLQSPFAALGNIICDAQYYQYHAAAPGEYSLSVGSAPHPRHQYLGEKILRGFTGQRISASLTVTADSASLGDVVTSPTHDGKSQISGVGAPFSFRLDGVASYGLLKQWGTQVGDLAKLLLLKGDSDQQAKLCWNIERPDTKRLQCVVWQAPANWQRGQQLQVVDQYLVDDRSVHEGEKGFEYWRGRFPQ